MSSRLNPSFSRMATLAVLMLAATGCVSLPGDTPEAKRTAALSFRDDVLAEAAIDFPELQAELDASPGYVVLNSAIFKTIIGHVGGYGVAVDQSTKKETYVKQSVWALGPLLEFGNAHSVIVFHEKEAFDAMLAGEFTWRFGADADASFRFGDFGGDVSATAVGSAATVYRMFQTGLGLNACILWASIEPDDELNL